MVPGTDFAIFALLGVLQRSPCTYRRFQIIRLENLSLTYLCMQSSCCRTENNKRFFLLFGDSSYSSGILPTLLVILPTLRGFFLLIGDSSYYSGILPTHRGFFLLIGDSFYSSGILPTHLGFFLLIGDSSFSSGILPTLRGLLLFAVY